MRKGWHIAKLGDICKFENGDRGKNYPGRKAFVQKGIPFINAGHLTDGGIDVVNMDFIPRDRFNLLSNGKIADGDLLFCLRGSLGKFAVVEGLKEGAIASSLIIVRPKDRLNKYYLAAYFRSSLCSDMIERFENGAAQPNLSAKSLSLFEIPLPSLPEQARIVAILDEAFEGIAVAVANAEKNLANARALFNRYLQAAFNRRGDGWRELSLGDIAQVKGGKRVPKGYKLLTEPTGFPYLRVTDFTETGTIDISDLRYVSKEVQKQIQAYVIYSTDLYVSIAGTIGRTGIIPQELDGSQLTENACRLVFKQDFSNRFVYYFTQTSDFIEQTIVNTRTAAQPKLALSRLSTIRLGFPNFAEQERLADSFDRLREETQRLESVYRQKLACLAELKQAILQKAFAGELTAQPEKALQKALA